MVPIRAVRFRISGQDSKDYGKRDMTLLIAGRHPILIVMLISYGGGRRALKRPLEKLVGCGNAFPLIRARIAARLLWEVIRFRRPAGL